MEERELEKLYKFEQFYWWHVGRRKIIESLLKKSFREKENDILEMGCGTGGNLGVLSKFGRVMGLDNAEEALNFCRKRGFADLILGRAEKTSLKAESFDLVAALDVLEHIEDDEGVLKEGFRLLKNGGYFLAVVPAYRFLWSEHDEALGHKRRYSAPGLSDKLKKAGFDVVKNSYVISFVFPLVFLYRLFRRIFFPKSRKNLAYFIMPRPMNSFFIYILKLEAFLLKYIDLPFGVSVVCLAKKPTDSKK